MLALEQPLTPWENWIEKMISAQDALYLFVLAGGNLRKGSTSQELEGNRRSEKSDGIVDGLRSKVLKMKLREEKEKRKKF